LSGRATRPLCDTLTWYSAPSAIGKKAALPESASTQGINFLYRRASSQASMRAGSLSAWTVRGALRSLKHPRVDLPLIAAEFEALRHVRRIGQGGAIVSVTQARQHELSRRLLIGQALVGQQAETEQPGRRRREQEA
jgi:hypothetical protein